MRVLYFGILTFLNLSCSNNRNDLLLKYGNLNCSYKNSLVQRDSLKNTLSATNDNLISKKKELNELSERYYLKINELDKRMFEIETLYVQRFNEISEKHEAKHGHMITPDYERSINSLEDWKSKKLKPLKEKLVQLEKERQDDVRLLKLEKTVDSLEKALNEKNETLIQNGKQTDEVKKKIQYIEREMEEQIQALSGEKRKQFIEHKYKLKHNPCTR